MASSGQAGWRTRQWRVGNAATAQPEQFAESPAAAYPQASRSRGRRAPTATATLAPSAYNIEESLKWPWQGVQFSFAYVAFLVYIIVISSYILPLGQAAMIAAIIGVMSSNKERVRMPKPLAFLLGFFVLVAVTYKSTQFSSYNWIPLQDLSKLVIVSFIGFAVLTDRARVRFFLFVYIGIFALFPIRGALFNSFIYHSATQGRVAWNNIFENPNDFGALMLFPLAVAASMFLTEKNKTIRMLALAGTIVVPLTIFATQSRGAILALGVAVAFSILIQGKGRMKSLILIASAGAVVAIFAPSSVWSRLSNLRKATESGNLENAGDDQSAEQRLEIMRVAVSVTKSFPVTGVGWAGYPNAHGAFARRSQFKSLAGGERDAHNTYLTLLAETGILGFGLYMGMIWVTVSQAIKAQRRIRRFRPDYAAQLKLLMLALLAYGVCAMFGTFAQIPFIYLHVITLIALTSLANQDAQVFEQQSLRPRA